MRNDDPNRGPGKSPEGANGTARAPLGAVWAGFLCVLLGATSLALASVSGWLVGPYLVLMVWLLGSPGRHRSEEGARVDRSTRENRLRGRETQAEGPPPSSEGVTVEPAREASEPPSEEEAPPKPRRGRGRSRKPAKAPSPPPEPVSVTWVQVGPGQFVRVEEAPPPTDGGPDSSGAPAPESEKADSDATAVETPEAHDTNPQPEQVASSETPEDPELPDSEPGTGAVEAETATEPQEIGEPEPVEVASEPDHEPEPETPAVLEVEETAPVEEAGSETGEADETPTVEEPVEVEAHVVETADVPEPAIEPECQVEAPDANTPAPEGEVDESETALADPKVGEGDLPQAGTFEDSGVESEGEMPEDVAPGDEERPEFDGESRTVFDPDDSLAPTRARRTVWPGWLPRARSLRVLENVRGFEPAATRPSRVRSVPRAVEGPRRHRSWHGALRYEPRAPPESRVRRPAGMRRLARGMRSRGPEMPGASQAA